MKVAIGDPPIVYDSESVPLAMILEPLDATAHVIVRTTGRMFGAVPKTWTDLQGMLWLDRLEVLVGIRKKKRYRDARGRSH